MIDIKAAREICDKAIAENELEKLRARLELAEAVCQSLVVMQNCGLQGDFHGSGNAYQDVTSHLRAWRDGVAK